MKIHFFILLLMVLLVSACSQNNLQQGPIVCQDLDGEDPFPYLYSYDASEVQYGEDVFSDVCYSDCLNGCTNVNNVILTEADALTWDKDLLALEAYCENNQPKYAIYTCPEGFKCNNGRCIEVDYCEEYGSPVENQLIINSAPYLHGNAFHLLEVLPDSIAVRINTVSDTIDLGEIKEVDGYGIWLLGVDDQFGVATIGYNCEPVDLHDLDTEIMIGVDPIDEPEEIIDTHDPDNDLVPPEDDEGDDDEEEEDSISSAYQGE